MSCPCRLMALLFRHPWLSLGVVLLIACLGFGALQGAGYLRYRRHYQAAEQAIARYDFERASQHLTECLRWRPKDAALLLLAARTARRADLPKQAEALLRSYREQVGKPTPEGALERALLDAQGGGQLHLVEDDLADRLAQDDPNSELILEALAEGNVKVYRTDKAMICLRRLVQEHPNNVPARLLRGVVSESMGNMKAALEDYGQAVKSDPDNYRARLRLAEALLKHQRPKEAVSHFERLLQAGPRQPAALLGLAQCRLQQHRRDDAHRLLDELLEQAPRDGNGLRERGKLALDDGELAKAERLLRQAVAAQPYDREAAYQLSICLGKLGQKKEAAQYEKRVKRMEEDLRRLEVLYPQTVKTPEALAPRLEIGRICVRNHRDDEARRWFNSVLHLDKHNREANRALAEIYHRHGDSDRAREHRRLAGDPPSD